MRILAVDVGTGTQDILFLDTALAPENAFKLVVPSPTMRVARQVRELARQPVPPSLVLEGVIMGGGPCYWAIRDYASAGHAVYATPHAAQTFDDDLNKVQAMGIRLVSDDEAGRINGNAVHLRLSDFEPAQIATALAAFGVKFDPDVIAVAAFDHGAAPPNVSDRQFRFAYLDYHLRAYNRLSAFAFPADRVPPSMTRLKAIAETPGVIVPLVVMDTAPAAVLGATLDPWVRSQQRALVVNVGNFHTLAFRLGPMGVEGVFEHHTGELTTAKLDDLIGRLADSSLRHEDVFNDEGHGALIYHHVPTVPDGLAVIGPRRAMLRESRHRPYFAGPYGDMMLAGSYGLIRPVADALPEFADEILSVLAGQRDHVPPWEILP